MTERTEYEGINTRRNHIEADKVGLPDSKNRTVHSYKMRGNELKSIIQMACPTTVKDWEITKKPGQYNESEIKSARNEKMNHTFSHGRRWCHESKMVDATTRQIMR